MLWESTRERKGFEGGGAGGITSRITIRKEAEEGASKMAEREGFEPSVPF